MQIFTSIKEVPIIKNFSLDLIPKGQIRNFWLNVISDGFGNPISIPLLVARGTEAGPVLGLTAAVV